MPQLLGWWAVLGQCWHDVTFLDLWNCSVTSVSTA